MICIFITELLGNYICYVLGINITTRITYHFRRDRTKWVMESSTAETAIMPFFLKFTLMVYKIEYI